MARHTLHDGQRSHSSTLLSLIHPNKELFQRHRALLRHAVPAGLPASLGHYDARHRTSVRHLIQHKDSTIFMRVSGDLLRGLNIFDGDLLVVDRSAPATDGCIIIAALDGEFTVRRLLYTEHGPLLCTAHPDHPDHPDVLVRPEQDLTIWGVVQWNAHKSWQPV